MFTFYWKLSLGVATPLLSTGKERPDLSNYWKETYIEAQEVFYKLSTVEDTAESTVKAIEKFSLRCVWKKEVEKCQ